MLQIESSVIKCEKTPLAEAPRADASTDEDCRDRILLEELATLALPSGELERESSELPRLPNILKNIQHYGNRFLVLAEDLTRRISLYDHVKSLFPNPRTPTAVYRGLRGHYALPPEWVRDNIYDPEFYNSCIESAQRFSCANRFPDFSHSETREERALCEYLGRVAYRAISPQHFSAEKNTMFTTLYPDYDKQELIDTPTCWSARTLEHLKSIKTVLKFEVPAGTQFKDDYHVFDYICFETVVEVSELWKIPKEKLIHRVKRQGVLGASSYDEMTQRELSGGEAFMAGALDYIYRSTAETTKEESLLALNELQEKFLPSV